MRKMQRKTYTKLMLTIIVASILITPILSASAKKYDEPGSIPTYPVTKKVIRFEEQITLSFTEWDGMTLPEGVYYTVNVYGVDVGNGVILIDSGDDDLAPELYKSVTHAFNKPILAVYLTHYHSDHAGGGLYFQSMGIPVYAPAYEMDFIDAGANPLGDPLPPDFTYTGYMPDYAYEEIELYPRFEIIPDAGHTMGQVAIQYRHGHTMYLFSADTILPMPDDPYNLDITDMVTLMTADQNYQNSVPDYDLYGTQLATLYDMLETIGGYDYVLTGHVDPMDSTTALEYIQYTIQVLESFPLP
jgi:glyoxylase-like metal-dependent hydrolase (beta-lactamase superfamily II)